MDGAALRILAPPAASPTVPRALPVYAALAAFLVGTVLFGMVGGAASRVFYVVGCIGIAHHAYRAGGLPLHAQVLIVLFVSSALLRRILDLHVGYDPAGTMLIGPVLAALVVLGELDRVLGRRDQPLRAFVPYLLMFGCVGYGWCISAFQNSIVDSSIAAIRYVAPLLYCMALMARPDQSDAVLSAAAAAFLAVSPVIGLYGLWQHLAPQPWDALWMIQSRMDSIGQPYPGMVRVFSTMNSPASFAAFATCGLFLFTFTRSTVIPPVLIPVVGILPLCLAILLSGVRTAWISAAASLLFCALFHRTRGRATLLFVLLVGAGAFTVVLTPLGEQIGARLGTMTGNVAQDGSGGERMSDYTHVFLEDSRYLAGAGLSQVFVDTRMAALDGQLLRSAVHMGLVVGMAYMACLLWTACQALVRLDRNASPLRLVAAALVVGNVVVLPLTAVASGEIGFIVWMLIGVLTVAPPVDAA